MNKRVFITSIFLFAITSIVLIACQTKSRILEFKIEKDREYLYNLDWDMKQTVYGQSSDMNIGSVYSLKLIEDDGNIKTLTGTYKSVKMSFSIKGKVIHIDTDKQIEVETDKDMNKNSDTLMKKIFSGIAGKSFKMKVDKNGKILEVTGLLELYESMLNVITLDKELKAEAMTALKEQFNEKSLKDLFTPMFSIYPNKEIKPGDTWEKEYSSSGNLPLNYATTYSVKEIEGDQITLNAKTKIKATNEMEIHGSQNGTILIDSKSGLIIRAEYDQSIESNLRGMKINMEGKGKINGILK